MSVDSLTQAILLLTAQLGKKSGPAVRALTPTEWQRFRKWLHDTKLTPRDLIEATTPEEILRAWDDTQVPRERILALLGRKASLGMVLERWERAGLWVITRKDSDYPVRIAAQLGGLAPAFFVGHGNRGLLNAKSIAVIGSRDASEADLEFTTQLGRNIAEHSYAVVSGGARGVDQTSMLGAIEAGGSAIGIMSDGLMKAITSPVIRDAFETDQLVLITSFNPEAPFHVGNAMARNKYVYTAACAAVVVASGHGKGGTWSGAQEALRRKWVPVWVRRTSESPPGNAALVDSGANDLDSRMPTPQELLAVEQGGSDGTQLTLPMSGLESMDTDTERLETQVVTVSPESVGCMSFLHFFVLKLATVTTAEIDAKAIKEEVGLVGSDINHWLKEGVQAELIEEFKKPKRYRIAPDAVPRIWKELRRSDLKN